MEIHEQTETFIKKGNDIVFDHTKIIFKQNEDEYFYATTTNRLVTSVIDLSRLSLVRITTGDIWPEYQSQLTQFTAPLRSNAYYLKEPCLLYYGDSPSPSKLSEQLLHEAEICEFLRSHPHPNVAQYLGCVVKSGRIKGLCFQSYPMTLLERLEEAMPVDTGRCLRGIQRGVEHLHGLGIIHNDLKPSNIMMNGDEPVIIDFDSATREGEPLCGKAGTPGWAMMGSDYAKCENDTYSLSKIRDFLVEGKCDREDIRHLEKLRFI
ncbi:kinase-like domain-containing protein [Aspergillus avenaceus]|uniref:Kinase-like domain-containing protein n=1 Tax=Aspergillus avenaceus TaxID=36643 RepID=A0A5N6U712_ASPAV|nr:kinase-like domain-containing protein [Aspergillus avenaceus]